MALFGLNRDRTQERLDNEAVQTLKGIAVPDQESMILQLQQLVEQGQISPEEAQTYLQEESAFNAISLDPRFKNAQLDALASLEDIAANDGLRSSDRARLNDIQTEEDTRARGAREAILQNAQARGISGSGVELLNNLTNAQESATRASQRGFDVAALAEERALEALQSAGQLGMQMESNQFGQKARIADANDAISRFNTQNKQAVELGNVGARNQAQEKNLANKQAIANANVDLANKQQQYNKELNQQKFQNEMAKGQAVAGALNKTGANRAAGESSEDQSARQLIGAGITAGAMAMSDEKLKENIEEFSPSEFLDNLTSYKYNYKNPKFGKGEQVGVMAQDLEKAAPQMVEETPEGKVVDYEKAGGPLFASLADLHERLKRLEGN